MPVPFDDPSDRSAAADRVAWLRLVEEEGGKGVLGALFQSSAQGEPAGFCFTRTAVYDSRVEANAAIQSTKSFVATSLLRNAVPTPVLILGLSAEIPAGVFSNGLGVRMPLCRIGNASVADADGEPFEFCWATERPSAESSARRLLGELMERDNPLEPFERAAAGLKEAFADEHIEALTSVVGLTNVVSLHSLGESPARPSYPSAETRESTRTPGMPQRVPTLAERLWAALAAPPPAQRRIALAWPGELMPFQQDGVRVLMGNPRLLLADDMGLGKTVQTIAALRLLWARREVESCLVVAPASVLDQWRREIEKWAPEFSAIVIRGSADERSWQWQADRDVVLVSYDTLRSDFGGNAQAPIRRKKWDVVVADEAQRVKNRNPTSAALKGLRRTRSWALTGTPVENHEEELASILEFVDHDEAGTPKRYRSGVELRERHKELQLRRKKGEVLRELPPKQIRKIPIELGSRQRASYHKAERDGIVYLNSLGSDVRVRHVLELITRLKQICNADPKTGESSKLDDIGDRLERLAAQGHKALVFSQYTGSSSGVAAAASYLHGFAPLTITGDVPPQERADTIERFRTRPAHKVLILSLRAGGLGLNLQEASYVFHLDRWWNPAVERQAEDRTHRLGQTVKVNVIKYSCAGTIEERIDRILESKQEIFDRLVDDVSLDLSAQMSSEELFGLFGLQRG